MKSKLILLIIMIFAVFTAAIAGTAQMDIFPSNDVFKAGEDFLVFGYYSGSEEIEESDIKLKVYDDDDNLVETETPRFEPRSGEEPTQYGYFYEKMSLSTDGEYRIKVKIDGDTEDTESIEIKDVGSRELTIKDFDYTIINNNQIRFEIEIDNNENEEVDVTVYLSGANNIRTPKTFSVDVDANEKETFKRTYSLSQFGTGEFIVVAQAKTDEGNDESYSLPKYIFVDTMDNGIPFSNEAFYDPYYYQNDDPYEPYYSFYNSNNDFTSVYTGYGNIHIVDIVLDTSIFYPGEIVEGYATLKNIGSYESQYKFEYSYDNQAFKTGDVNYIQPYTTKQQPIVVEVPDEDDFKLRAKVYSTGLIDSEEKTFLVSSKFKYFSIYLDEGSDVIEAGSDTSFELTLRNRGNEDDVYRIDLEGWDLYNVNSTVSVKAGSEEKLDIDFTVLESEKVGSYPVIVEICSIEDICRTKTLNLVVTKPEVKQSELIFDENLTQIYFEENETLNVTLTLTNMELEDKEYIIELDSDDVDFDVSEDEFTLEYEESKTVTINMTAEDNENKTVNLDVYADGEKIFVHQIELEYTEDKERAMSGITGFTIFESDGVYWPGVILLGLMAVGVIAFFGYRIAGKKLGKKIWTEKAVAYRKPMPRMQPRQAARPAAQSQTHYPMYPQQRPQIQPQNQPRHNYHPDSFMRKF